VIGAVRAAGDAAQAALIHGAAALGVALTDAQIDQFAQLSARLQEGKRAFNLTALTDPVDIAVKHFVDALTVLAALPADTRRVIDVGTGAGFPGLPLKIARPDLEMTLLEATTKKAEWVRGTAAALGLEGTDVVTGRAEEAAHEQRFRAHFDAAVARALAPLPVLLELCLPFVRPGGVLVAQKTSHSLETELPQARRALEVLGGRLRAVRPVELPELPNRVLLVVEQIRQVPAQYPRRPGVPGKKPL